MENLLPENWTKFSDTELKDVLLPTIRQEGLAVANGIEGAPTEDQLNQINAYVAAAKAIQDELSGRVESAAAAVARQDELASALASLTEEAEAASEDTTEDIDEDATDEFSVETDDVAEVAPEVAEDATADAEELAVETETETVEVSDEAEAELTTDEDEGETLEESVEELGAEAEDIDESVSDEANAVAETEELEVVETEEVTEEAEALEVDNSETELAEGESEETVIDTAEEAELEVVSETADADTEVAEDAADDIEEMADDSESAITPDEIIETPVQENTEMANTNDGAEAPDFYVPQDNASGRVTASVGALTKSNGDTFNNTFEMAQEAIEQFRRHGGERRWSGLEGTRMDRVNFASTSYGDTGTKSLSTMNEVANTTALDDVVGDFTQQIQNQVADGESLLVASGGICAPFEQDYSFCRLAQPQSFIESCLPRVAAPRGGIRFILPPDFKAARAGITTVTCHEDAAGYESTPEECLPEGVTVGTTPDKPCVCVECPEIAECCVTAVPWCVRWGNFNYYTFPELVENFMRDLQVAYAKVKETFYLDQLMANSIVATSTTSYGAVRDILWDLRSAAVNYRKVHNMNLDAVLQVVAPHWLIDVMKQDIANSTWGSSPFDYLKVSDAQIAECLRDLGLQLCVYYDTPTMLPEGVPSQAFDQEQVDGDPINQFPSKAVTFLFAPGTFVRLDGGNLDFGIIRDSSLVATNDFIMAAEEFIGLCPRGCGDSIALVHDVCPSGSGAAASGPFCNSHGEA